MFFNYDFTVNNDGIKTAFVITEMSCTDPITRETYDEPIPVSEDSYTLDNLEIINRELIKLALDNRPSYYTAIVYYCNNSILQVYPVKDDDGVIVDYKTKRVAQPMSTWVFEYLYGEKPNVIAASLHAFLGALAAKRRNQDATAYFNESQKRMRDISRLVAADVDIASAKACCRTLKKLLSPYIPADTEKEKYIVNNYHVEYLYDNNGRDVLGNDKRDEYYANTSDRQFIVYVMRVIDSITNRVELPFAKAKKAEVFASIKV